MFQAREPQESPTPKLIPERGSGANAPMYSPDMGRPNRAVQTVLGVLVLKEISGALEELEQSAVAPCPEDAPTSVCG